ncbi:hypothetical protein [Mesorhizobium sp. ORM8.1]
MERTGNGKPASPRPRYIQGQLDQNSGAELLRGRIAVDAADLELRIGEALNKFRDVDEKADQSAMPFDAGRHSADIARFSAGGFGKPASVALLPVVTEDDHRPASLSGRQRESRRFRSASRRRNFCAVPRNIPGRSRFGAKELTFQQQRQRVRDIEESSYRHRWRRQLRILPGARPDLLSRREEQ